MLVSCYVEEDKEEAEEADKEEEEEEEEADKEEKEEGFENVYPYESHYVMPPLFLRCQV